MHLKNKAKKRNIYTCIYIYTVRMKSMGYTIDITMQKSINHSCPMFTATIRKIKFSNRVIDNVIIIYYKSRKLVINSTVLLSTRKYSSVYRFVIAFTHSIIFKLASSSIRIYLPPSPYKSCSDVEATRNVNKQILHFIICKKESIV